MPTYKNRQCKFTEDKVKYIDYKNVGLLSEYLTKYGKIVPRYYSGTGLRYQKKLSRAIKNARFMGLLPYIK